MSSPIRQSAYLGVLSSGGAPTTSVLGSEIALSTGAPADPGDPAGDVAAVWGQEFQDKDNTESEVCALNISK